MLPQSSVGIELSYTGDPFVFWEILKAMKVEAEKSGVIFECGRVTTFTMEE